MNLIPLRYPAQHDLIQLDPIQLNPIQIRILE